MISRKDLEEYVIYPALYDIQMQSEEAIHLLIVTATLESDLGFYLKQTNGPALGIYQMEPQTHDCVWDNVLADNTSKLTRMIKSNNGISSPNRMIYDLKYATCMARMQYSRYKAAIPGIQDYEGIINYYLRYWKPNPRVMNYKKAKIKYKHYFGTGINDARE